MSEEEVKKSLSSAVGKFSRDFLSIGAALSLLASILYFVLAPKVEPYINLPEDVSRIVQILERNNLAEHPVFLEIKHVWVPTGPYQPGSTVDMSYWLRRNSSCKTDVLVRFLNFRTNRYFTEVRMIPAIESTRTEDFRAFPISVKIPENLPDGIWAYHPTLTCDGVTITPPPAFFIVESSGGPK